jgi:UDP-GlcNAc3NAcA epimerase
MKKKVVTVVGARPQFIKVAPVSQELRKHHTEILIHTGQHFDAQMSDVFFDELNIPEPDYHLGVSGGSHGAMTAKMLEKLEELFLKISPELVLLYGDTNSTLAAALAASKLHIPIAHVESGPRTYDRCQPEEINRSFTDYVSSIRFCPTFQSVENLKLENMSHGTYHVGDVMYDSALFAREKASKQSKILEKLKLKNNDYIVATIHRAEHTTDRIILEKIIAYLKKQPFPVIFPIHPRTSHAINTFGINTAGLNIISPLGYLDMTWLVSNARQVITDSGGLPKEAYFHKVPCITIGEYTPWPETVSAGWNRLWTQTDYQHPRSDISDYGDGNASKKIVSILNNFLNK